MLPRVILSKSFFACSNALALVPRAAPRAVPHLNLLCCLVIRLFCPRAAPRDSFVVATMEDAESVAMHWEWQATVAAQKLEKSVACSSCFFFVGGRGEGVIFYILELSGPPGAIFEAGTQKDPKKETMRRKT